MSSETFKLHSMERVVLWSAPFTTGNAANALAAADTDSVRGLGKFCGTANTLHTNNKGCVTMASEKSLENRIAVLEKLVGRLLLLADGEIEKSSDGDELIHPPPASGSQVNWAAVACVLSNEMDYYCGACPADQKGTWDYVVSGPLSASYCAKYCESKGAECWLRWAIMEAKKCQSSG